MARLENKPNDQNRGFSRGKRIFRDELAFRDDRCQTESVIRSAEIERSLGRIVTFAEKMLNGHTGQGFSHQAGVMLELAVEERQNHDADHDQRNTRDGVQRFAQMFFGGVVPVRGAPKLA